MDFAEEIRKKARALAHKLGDERWAQIGQGSTGGGMKRIREMIDTYRMSDIRPEELLEKAEKLIEASRIAEERWRDFAKIPRCRAHDNDSWHALVHVYVRDEECSGCVLFVEANDRFVEQISPLLGWDFEQDKSEHYYASLMRFDDIYRPRFYKEAAEECLKLMWEKESELHPQNAD